MNFKSKIVDTLLKHTGPLSEEERLQIVERIKESLKENNEIFAKFGTRVIVVSDIDEYRKHIDAMESASNFIDGIAFEEGENEENLEIEAGTNRAIKYFKKLICDNEE